MTITSHHTAHPHTGPLPIAVPKLSDREGKHRVTAKTLPQHRAKFVLKNHGVKR